MNKAKFLHHVGCQHERIEFGLPHALIQTIDREGNREPGLQETIKIIFTVGIKIDFGAQRRGGLLGGFRILISFVVAD